MTYTYNIRNWLTGINSTPFTQNLYYNTGNGTARYNGNISSMTWKVGNESVIRGYKFTYDGLNRMLNATYGETTAINSNTNRFSENVTNYDKNGNIKNLQRYGQTSASAYGLIDNLTYTLAGNQLNRVDDAVTSAAYNGSFEFKNGASAPEEYTYDVNGNLTKDLNKGITAIQYNCLNLPNTVSFSDGSTITYTYAADGTKLRTVHKIGSVTTTTDYCGNVIYENGAQKYLFTEEGYVNLIGTQQYHYYLKDHQGNNRVVISQGGSAEETNHYYPFGGIFASTNIQPYKYNGKEYDTKKGLNWYDYGARHYDVALGRFTTVDPFAEKYYSVGPYVYCNNNPIRFIDPDGKGWGDAWPHLKNSVSATLSVGLNVKASVKVESIGIGVGINMGNIEYGGKEGMKLTRGISTTVGVFGVEKSESAYEFNSSVSVKEDSWSVGFLTTNEEHKEKTYVKTEEKSKVLGKEKSVEVTNEMKMDISVHAILGIDLSIDLSKIGDFVSNLFK